MSETNKPNVMLEEQNIASTSEQAIVASTSESLTEQSIAEVQTAPEATEVVAEPTDNVEDASVKSVTRQEIIGRLEEIADSEDALNCKAEVENLKVQFYKLRTAEIDAARKAFVADGGEENVFIPEPEEVEEMFQEHLRDRKQYMKEKTA